MNMMIRLLSAFAIQASALAAMSSVTTAQPVPAAPQQKMMQRVCSVDAVDNLLPPPQSQQSNSGLSYLQEQGFIQQQDGSWVCYVSSLNKEDRYYTLFKVQQINGRLVASSFLQNGSLIDGQDNRSLDLFMMLIENHTNIKQGNRQSIRRYLSSFISLVKQGKMPLSQRKYLFDQPNRGVVFYYPITGGKLQGTAITININNVAKR